ncbi:AAA family ATPase [Kordia jejudonensis]|uniref:AAA family ATPase n=1 Tax=Kordia jejudonensis TaxID=1348245 RepID=UPI0006291793|nr:AAA family ATPase [Kordia jejudonensis]
MIKFKVNRLIITSQGNIVYDEPFHDGVNIIRGENGSGKSTIANALFYSIGGEFTDWLPEALQCDFTIVEVEINDSILTFKREISDKTMRPMQIFHGSIDKALKSNFDGWKVYGYRRSENKKSFSEYLFNFLKIPEVKTERGETVTLNQIYRLIYLDQLSSITALLNNEDFDSPLIRTTLGSLLFGTYENELYDNQIKYRKKKKILDEIDSEYRFLKKVLDATDTPTTIKGLNLLLNENKKALKELDERIIKIDNSEKVTMSKLSTDLNKIAKSLTNEKKKLKLSNDEIYSLELNIIDSEEFIKELNNRLESSEESLIMREYFSELPISYCPSCLEELKPVDENHCKLCKEPLLDKQGKERIERMKIELKTQISESERLLLIKRSRLENLLSQKQNLNSKVNRIEKEYSNLVDSTKSKTQRVKEGLLVDKGFVLSIIADLEDKLINVEKYNFLGDRLKSLSGEVTLLKTKIDQLEDELKTREQEARRSVQEFALELLHKEGGYEKFFETSSYVKLDFVKNSYYLNNRNHFSASSMVYLKNAIRFAIFFASLKHDYFRYPRFIICDNMEDKGMNPERSHIFQRNIVELSKTYDNKEYQIIFTTSMIDSSLNINEYTVGEEYNPNNKSLNFRS